MKEFFTSLLGGAAFVIGGLAAAYLVYTVATTKFIILHWPF